MTSPSVQFTVHHLRNKKTFRNLLGFDKETNNRQMRAVDHRLRASLGGTDGISHIGGIEKSPESEVSGRFGGLYLVENGNWH